MPRFEPFPGVRYDTRRFDLADVTAPPYDVLSAADREALCRRSSHNVVCIDLPLADEGEDRYVLAGERFRAWRAQGALVTDGRPSLTVYRMRYADDRGRPATTVGVIGALQLSRPEEGDVLPHEHTTPKARSDRLDLLRGTRANLSAVWGLSLTRGLTGLLETADPPEVDWTDDDDVAHTAWRVEDPDRVAAIATAVAASPVVIADGHHRYETSLAYRDEVRAREGAGTTADATMSFVVELVQDQLTVRPIHRLIGGLPDGYDLPRRLAGLGFATGGTTSVEEVLDGRVLERMAAEGAIAVVTADGKAQLLRVDRTAFDGSADLDSARVAMALDRLPEHWVSYQHGVDLVAKAVGNGEAQFGILLRPATVSQIEQNAHAGQRMPAKTTFFSPKPKTGVVFRSLEGP